jgi:hypothetical protein
MNRKIPVSAGDRIAIIPTETSRFTDSVTRPEDSWEILGCSKRKGLISTASETRPSTEFIEGGSWGSKVLWGPYRGT